MKICRYCGLEQSEENFEVARIVNGKVYRRLKCAKCKLQTQNERKNRIRSWLESYKRSHHCERCGASDYRVLEFHHRDSAEKDANVSDMLRQGLSIASIQKEIEKCRVLCANCHRIEHYEV